MNNRSENQPPSLSASEVSHLDFCVACGVAWTIKKTATQKAFHIQSCGRRNGFTLTTIRELLLNPSKAKSIPQLPKPKQGNAPTKSLMEHLLDDKKLVAKKRKIKASIPSVLETGRAQGVLQDRLRSTFQISDDTEGYPDLPPTTQSFGSSKLAQRFANLRRPVERLVHSDEETVSSASSDGTLQHMPSEVRC
jgi:hypothetical protein